MDTNEKIIIAVALIIFICVSTFFLIKYKDEVFTNKVTLTYPDGCSEIYSNEVLITEPCPNNNDLQFTFTLFNDTDEYNG